MYTSSQLQLTQGDPQGSTLGALLFVLYVNALIMHAHDTDVFFTSRHLETLEKKKRKWVYDITIKLAETKRTTVKCEDDGIYYIPPSK